jgi:hypothetical protein
VNSSSGLAHMGANDKNQDKSATATQRAPVEIGIVIYPDCQLSAVHGLTDLFRIANRLCEQNAAARRRIRISHWKFDEAGLEPVRVFDTHHLTYGPLTALILPPSLDAEPGGNAIARHLRWLVAQHGTGTILCSVCAGAFLLAEAGLLNGRSATTHWIHARSLASPESSLTKAQLRHVKSEFDTFSAHPLAIDGSRLDRGDDPGGTLAMQGRLVGSYRSIVRQAERSSAERDYRLFLDRG